MFLTLSFIGIDIVQTMMSVSTVPLSILKLYAKKPNMFLVSAQLSFPNTFFSCRSAIWHHTLSLKDCWNTCIQDRWKVKCSIGAQRATPASSLPVFRPRDLELGTNLEDYRSLMPVMQSMLTCIMKHWYHISIRISQHVRNISIWISFNESLNLQSVE